MDDPLSMFAAEEESAAAAAAAVAKAEAEKAKQKRKSAPAASQHWQNEVRTHSSPQRVPCRRMSPMDARKSSTGARVASSSMHAATHAHPPCTWCLLPLVAFVQMANNPFASAAAAAPTPPPVPAPRRQQPNESQRQRASLADRAFASKPKPAIARSSGIASANRSKKNGSARSARNDAYIRHRASRPVLPAGGR